ncbi:CRISPR-associated helicase Cas3' [Candidatus Bathyarchaeota archaeon]|nr:CRISPR-associated helicase Cas3' [Candidatus Bathyarchaeota archaeon]
MECIFSKDLLKRIASAQAKKGISLRDHSKDVGTLAEAFVDRIFVSEDVLKFLERILGLSESMIKDCIVGACFLHDIGKLDKGFQKRLCDEGGYSTPHALLSLSPAEELLDQYLRRLYPKIEDQALRLLLDLSILSIATHHSDYHSGLYERYKFDSSTDNFLNANKSYKLLQTSYDNLSINLSDRYRRYLYVLFNGILRTCDWAVSGGLGLGGMVLDESYFLKSQIYDYFSRKGWNLRDYQELVRGQSIEAALLRLPTGDGKTETSLLPEVSGTNKLVYTLPTVTTVESMRKRFEEYFGKDNVCFSHHLMRLTLYDEERPEDITTFRYGMRKIIVTTIDRILLALMNFRHFPILELALNNSYLVVDEIHSYSPFTLSLILDALEYLRKYHRTRILVMSATLPSLIEEELTERIGARPLLPDELAKERYAAKKRVQVKLMPKGEVLSSQLYRILELFKEGKKVLVVLNTVSQARGIYEELKSQGLKYRKDIYLTHGRFCYQDKIHKSKFLEGLKDRQEVRDRPFILVSTQVVEVSLDIDFDVLFTEISPLDSLIQRFGRVNRKGRKGIAEAHICDVEDPNKPLPYRAEQIHITRDLLEDFKQSSELDFLKITDEYYNQVASIYLKEFGKSPLEQFRGQISKSEFGEELMKTRDGFITVPAVPVGRDLEIYNEIKEILDRWQSLDKVGRQKGFISIMRRIVEVPVSLIKDCYFEDRELRERFGLPFINVDYSRELGILEKRGGAIIF